MSAELIGILSVGAALFVGLGGLLLRLQFRTDKRLDALASALRRLAERVGALDRGQARIEGLLEGLGLSGRVPAGVDAGAD